MAEVVQLKVALVGTNPLVWRRFLIQKDNTFFELHHALQMVMGWENYHLFEFRVGNHRIGVPEEGFEEEDLVDAEETPLARLLVAENQTFHYLYDFGDGWEHVLEVEQFLPIDPELYYPYCLDGAMNCPPEDCGGIQSFFHLLEVISSENHPEKAEMLEWLEAPYDPTHFDKELLNIELKDFDGYIDEWFDGLEDA